MEKAGKPIKAPSVSAFYKPTVQALFELGGSGNIDEINERVYRIMNLSDEVLAIPHKQGRSKVEYRLAWARTRLKLADIIENSSRGVWAIANTSIDLNKITPTYINQRSGKAIKAKHENDDLKDVIEDVEDIDSWKESLLSKLYTITASSFERLAQRILRESGFIQVEVTGRSGDGGIDGKGILRINGFLSFHIIFQCKRYKGSISPSQIRDFRGAMQGRADKGLFITTGTFTREAIKEATRDGAPAIDLLDGDLLCDKLKELRLGVKTELIENVRLDLEWFDRI